MYRVDNTESGEFSYIQALKTVGKNVKDYQKGDTYTNRQYLDIRFQNVEGINNPPNSRENQLL